MSEKPQRYHPKPQRYYPSPVDYEAWAKGYLPPSEHILIDALAYRDAKIVSSCSTNDAAWWFVVRGKPLTVKHRAAIRALVLDMYLDDEEEAPPELSVTEVAPVQISVETRDEP